MARNIDERLVGYMQETTSLDRTDALSRAKQQIKTDLLEMADTCYDCIHENTKGERIDYIPVDKLRQYFGGGEE